VLNAARQDYARVSQKKTAARGREWAAVFVT
jgi:hypothetical protein